LFPEIRLGGSGYADTILTTGTIIVDKCVFTNNYSLGGGAIGNLGELLVTDCIFTNNKSSNRGGALDCSWERVGSSIIRNSTFINNHTGNEGGAICINNEESVIEGCTFINNSADNREALRSGGAIYCSNVKSITSCTFTGNSAVYGGGIHINEAENTNIKSCIFKGNEAGIGGGVYSRDGNMNLYNCLFVENIARDYGGAVSIANPDNQYAEISNCTIINNSAANGKALSVSNILLTNCIIRDGTEAIWNWGASFMEVNYCNIQNGLASIHDFDEQLILMWGDGNIEADPLFADPDNYDYHLKSQAGRFDPNTQTWVQDDVTSPCIDAGDPNSPIGNEPFPNGGYINMGAYGGTSEASKSYFGEPLCETIVAGDINGDCKVDELDWEIMLLHWLEEH
ncbi:MAG: right-handed parallel beta-helix repeat-containing protein, partial [Sedimentisphaerales bacterium]